jgi:hypothetical protein
LAHIASSHRDPRIRAIALKAYAPIADHETLLRVVKEESSDLVLDALVEGCGIKSDVMPDYIIPSNQRILGEVAKRHSYKQVGQKAFNKITNEYVLAHIATSHSTPEYSMTDEIKQRALDRIRDQQVLVDICLNGEDVGGFFVREHSEDICLAALERITNNDLLIKIARHYDDPDDMVGNTALRRVRTIG